MFFDKILNFLVFYLVLLLFVALMGMKFSKKHQEIVSGADLTKKKSLFKGLYKNCPCRKAVENGLMSSICIYSGIVGFMLSLTNIALRQDYEAVYFIVLGLSLVCLWFGWILKKG